MSINEDRKIRRHTFIRTSVDHYSFVTGLLTGGSVRVNVILDAHILHSLEGQCSLMGNLFQCRDLLTMFFGTYGSREINERKYPEGFVPPTDFETETWELISDDSSVSNFGRGGRWQLKSKARYFGVKCLDAGHTSDGGTSACAGWIKFDCDKMQYEDILDGEIVEVPQEESLRRVLQQSLPNPKHPPSYFG